MSWLDDHYIMMSSLSLGGVLLGHAEGHLTAEVVAAGGGEEECLVLTRANRLEVWLLTPY